MHWFALVVAVIANVLSNYAFKKAMTAGEARSVLALASDPWLWAGGASAGVLLLCYLYALRGVALSVAYPTVTGLAMAGIAVLGAAALGEALSPVKAGAVLMIVVGAAVLHLHT